MKNFEVPILCPFHKEKTPSCVLNTEKKTFYCFGCEKHGTFTINYVIEEEVEI